MAALSSVSLSFPLSNPQIRRYYRRLPIILASASSASAMPSHESSSSSTSSETTVLPSPIVPFVESSKTSQNGFVRLVQNTESTVERAIFDFRFLAFLAIGGSLAGSLLCFLNGCIYIFDAYKVYWSSCVKGIHTGQMVLRLVEAIDVYLAGTVMFIFGMGLYGLFITDVSADGNPTADRALKQSSLFGMFALKERPKWMKISSLDELKTKVGHVIVMILLVKMFERSKMVPIATGTDLLSYSVCIFLSSASLYILHTLHKSE
ncbi:uncharacterized protein LOC129886997 [Solanum dulcamara]|uniref:uncharacterized protein LOC129886997 n=1 Tax=Solanum dulcamara TaxID=45834 RepID=UPI002485E6E1|nr:uncharacterized protein LOC129886997 [Solanum dulcamara]